MGVLISAVVFLLMLGALADIITSDSTRVKHLPKLVWIIIVILLPLAGSILWFAIGHDYASSGNRASFPHHQQQGQQEGQYYPPSVSSVPSSKWQTDAAGLSTEEELAALEREIAADRIRRLEAEVDAKRREKGIES